MENALLPFGDENPKVTEKLASLNKISKEIRDQACQLITVPGP